MHYRNLGSSNLKVSTLQARRREGADEVAAD